jgi:hypothetical protein
VFGFATFVKFKFVVSGVRTWRGLCYVMLCYVMLLMVVDREVSLQQIYGIFNDTLCLPDYMASNGAAINPYRTNVENRVSS